MTGHKDEKWLDEKLQDIINGTTPVFDAGAWRRKYAKEYETLTARRANVAHRFSVGNRAVRAIPRRWIAGLAAAAAVFVVAGLVFLAARPDTSEPEGPTAPSPAATSPAEMVSLMSLTVAYRQGGEEALNRQLDTALDKLGPRPDGLLLTDLLGDLEG